MKQETNKHLISALFYFTAFFLWTTALRFLDVQPIGPRGSVVGFATLNGWFHALTGVHMKLYTLTDWMGLVPVAFGFGFALLGLIQWITRKQLQKVDRSILALGGFYLLVLITYLTFEKVVINYRPVLIEGFLEVSYPSSTTLLVMTVMPTAIAQLRNRIRHSLLRHWVCIILTAFLILMVVGRLISGVHWFSDIIGGLFLSAGLVAVYKAML